MGARKALLSTSTIPRKQKLSDPTKEASDDIPFYYDGDSWAGRLEIPWHEGERRAMTPAEGITLLATELEEKEAQLAALRRKVKAAAELQGQLAEVLSS